MKVDAKCLRVILEANRKVLSADTVQKVSMCIASASLSKQAYADLDEATLNEFLAGVTVIRDSYASCLDNLRNAT